MVSPPETAAPPVVNALDATLSIADPFSFASFIKILSVIASGNAMTLPTEHKQKLGYSYAHLTE